MDLVMTRSTKQVLLIVGIVGGVLIIAIAAIVGVGIYAISRSGFTKEYDAKEAEGREFGKTTDQAGCIKEALRRAQTIGVFDHERWNGHPGVHG